VRNPSQTSTGIHLHPGQEVSPLCAGRERLVRCVPMTRLALEGAQTQGRRGLLVSLDEHPAQILRNRDYQDLYKQLTTPALVLGLI